MRYIKNILLAAAAVMTISSCVSEVDDVFDKSSSQRIEEAMAADKAVLVNQTNGWVLKMYGDLDFGGYNVLLKFNEDNSLRVVSEAYYGGIGDKNYGQSDTYEVETSHYKLEQSAGVVLSFDQYSKNIHFFSDPANPAQLGPNYRGFWADLEFRVLSASPDSVVLQGKKHGNRLVMLPAPVDETGWQGYLDKVYEVEADMTKYPSYKVHVGDKALEVRLSNRCFTVTVPSATEEEGNTYLDIPYTCTPDGYVFYEPVDLMGNIITGFKYDPTSLFYPDMNNTGVKLESLVPPINQQFVEGMWFTSMSNLGAFGQAYWSYCKQNVMPVVNGVYPGTLDYCYFGSLGTTFGLRYMIIGYWGINGFDYQLVGEDEIKLVYNSKKNNANGDTFIGSGFLYMSAYFSAPFGNDEQATPVVRTFKITTDNVESPSWILLTDKNNPDNTIRLTKDVIAGNLFEN